MTQRIHVLINGSPRPQGVSAHLCQNIQHAIETACPDDHVDYLSVASLSIVPCNGCGGCDATGCCIHNDDMERVRPLIARCDDLIVVSPVYFAGPPAPYKALLDRMQPFYERWDRDRRRGVHARKRPARLIAVGEGGDPHGYDPLVVCTRSALAVAGFSLMPVAECISDKGDTPDLVCDRLMHDSLWASLFDTNCVNASLDSAEGSHASSSNGGVSADDGALSEGTSYRG